MDEFLQSGKWIRFQEATGREVVSFSQDGFLANGIIHELPLIGKYLYVPRGPVVEKGIRNQESRIKNGIQLLFEKAKEKKVGWIRIEPQAEELLEIIKKECEIILHQPADQGDNLSVVKAPHDMQPRETFVMDITPEPGVLLAGMKPKTRYNIGLAEKHSVKVFATREEKYKQAFFDLIAATADRKEITPHPRSYYEKFFSAFPENMCQLFVAEYDGKVVAANLLVIFGTRATYLHGGSGSAHRGVMAPYLLQWEQIKYAKEKGCTEYDFGGVKTDNGQQLTKNKSDWGGITRFKTGFSPQTKPVVFPGAYDIILNHPKYALYNRLRMLKESLLLMKRFLKM